MKKLVAILLCAVLCAACIAPAALAESGIGVTVNGKAVSWTDAAPFIDSNNRTLCPLRAVADAMGLTVTWNAESRAATFSQSGTNQVPGGSSYRYEKSLTFTIDSNVAALEESDYYEDGSDEHGDQPVEMDTAAVIVNNRTYAPIRYLAEAFGFGVNWDGDTKTVQVYDYVYWYSYFDQYYDVAGICFTPGKNYAQLKSVELLSVTVNGKAAEYHVMTATEVAELASEFAPGAFFAFYIYGAFEEEQSYDIQWTLKETHTDGSSKTAVYSDTWYVDGYGGY